MAAPFFRGLRRRDSGKNGEKSFTKLWALDCWFSRTNDQRFFALKKGATDWRYDSVFWALPVSTQWHIYSECLSSNTNKKPAQILRFAESKKEPLFRKILGKAAQNAVGKGTGPSNLPKPILASFCHASKNGCKKARKSLKLLGFSQRHLFWCSLMVETGGLEPSTSCV